LPFALPPADSSVTGRSRNNRLLAHAYREVETAMAVSIDRFGPARVGVVLGTSTAGVAEGEAAVRRRLDRGAWDSPDQFRVQELSDLARAAIALCGARGPAYVVSTACTSGAKAMTAAARLILTGLCDVVLCGGVDTLCDMTLNGFASLEAVSMRVSNPFSINRDGINIGEAAGLFVLSAEPAPWRLAGWGESSDAHHLSAPDPTGTATELAARKALNMAAISERDVGYVHLHGTGTRLNDAMEAALIWRLLGDAVPASSTKPLTGHTLGAAGACQAAFCLMAMAEGRLPPHVWDGQRDPDLAMIRLVETGETARNLRYCYSASYAFGGNNAALILARE
jgi:3-oxoacyl-[acyl-carrier-protein] synthase-1